MLCAAPSGARARESKGPLGGFGGLTEQRRVVCGYLRMCKGSITRGVKRASARHPGAGAPRATRQVLVLRRPAGAAGAGGGAAARWGVPAARGAHESAPPSAPRALRRAPATRGAEAARGAPAAGRGCAWGKGRRGGRAAGPRHVEAAAGGCCRPAWQRRRGAAPPCRRGAGRGGAAQFRFVRGASARRGAARRGETRRAQAGRGNSRGCGTSQAIFRTEGQAVWKKGGPGQRAAPRPQPAARGARPPPWGAAGMAAGRGRGVVARAPGGTCEGSRVPEAGRCTKPWGQERLIFFW
ncbi:MAG: hypothetical protein J3K34DRAFT_462026 [Monoraphidium minutum]|nr:MAG: hypothetical protein J3K34DRAFT_462026 [Monoraphidium minutum]